MAGNSRPAITNNLVMDNDYGIHTNGSQPRQFQRNAFFNNRLANYHGLNPGQGDILSDPKTVRGLCGDYYLSQVASGQSSNSPLVDAGLQPPEAMALNKEMTAAPEVAADNPDQGTATDAIASAWSSLTPASIELGEPAQVIDGTATISSTAMIDNTPPESSISAGVKGDDPVETFSFDVASTTTRTDGQPDQGPIDIGFHYPQPLPFRSYLPVVG